MVWIWETEIWSICRSLDSDGGRGIYKEDAPRFYSAFPPSSLISPFPLLPLHFAHSPPALLIVLYTPPSSSPTATSPGKPSLPRRTPPSAHRHLPFSFHPSAPTQPIFDPLPPSSSSSSHTTNSPYRLFIDPLARLPFAHIYSASLLPRFASLPTTTIFLLPSLPLVVVGDVLGYFVVVDDDVCRTLCSPCAEASAPAGVQGGVLTASAGFEKVEEDVEHDELVG
ncbi:hypothetical protein D9611_014910 [Ephemerocybe angulata]|uniref:Uncharacterized protein n=1 Tax=Ephemerocybe angulata TaxID=980116 RepID=A0A8H5AQK8_9AGAR|nr:hypothetical protein D9611_014910 [Tulosesus angulatus]